MHVEQNVMFGVAVLACVKGSIVLNNNNVSPSDGWTAPNVGLDAGLGGERRAPQSENLALPAVPNRQGAEDTATDVSDFVRNQRLVAAAEAKVLAALPRRLTDRALAQAIGVTETDLTEAVLAVHGDTVYRVMFKLRLRLAVKMLEQDETLSARAAARHCGFGYFGSFLRGYQEETGGPPRKTSKLLGLLPSGSDRLSAKTRLSYPEDGR